jgi:hypothetical protein
VCGDFAAKEEAKPKSNLKMWFALGQLTIVIARFFELAVVLKSI